MVSSGTKLNGRNMGVGDYVVLDIFLQEKNYMTSPLHNNKHKKVHFY